MNDIYLFVSGPLVWVATAVLCGGLCWRLIRYRIRARAAAKGVPAGFLPRWALASVFHFLLPLNRTARLSPWTTLAGFCLHIPLLTLMVLLSAHVVLIEQSLGLSWPTISDSWADALTVLALCSLLFLAGKRLLYPVTRSLSEPQDLLVLVLVALPLLTGLVAHRQWFASDAIVILHVLSALLLLVAIPFTKLAHVVFFFVSRSATGSDFGQREVESW